MSPKARMELITAGQNQVNQQLILDIRGNKGIISLLLEYRTAECILDWIDLLAFAVFHLSLDEDCNTAELL